MASKNKNGLYLLVLVILAGIFILVKYVFTTKPDSNFDMNQLSVDTAKVASVLIKQPKDKAPIKLIKENNNWKVSQDNKSYDADASSIKGILGVLAGLKIENIAGISKDKWADYQLTDSAATNVQLFDGGGKILKDFYIGKFIYKQNQSPYGQMYGRNNISGKTYIRLSNGEKSFIVNGFIPMTFNRDLNSFRNHTVAKIDKNNVTHIKFDYATEQSFELTKTDSAVWMINQKDTADFNKITQYLNSIAWLRQMKFDDNFSPSDKAISSLTYEGQNMQPTTIRVYQKDSVNYVVNSSQYPKTYFSYKQNEVDRQFKKTVSDFMKNEKTK